MRQSPETQTLPKSCLLQGITPLHLPQQIPNQYARKSKPSPPSLVVWQYTSKCLYPFAPWYEYGNDNIWGANYSVEHHLWVVCLPPFFFFFNLVHSGMQAFDLVAFHRATARAQQQQLQQQQQQQQQQLQSLLPVDVPSEDVPPDVVGEETTAQPWPVDPNEPRYCICNDYSYGDMVGCDNNDVSIANYWRLRNFQPFLLGFGPYRGGYCLMQCTLCCQSLDWNTFWTCTRSLSCIVLFLFFAMMCVLSVAVSNRVVSLWLRGSDPGS